MRPLHISTCDHGGGAARAAWNLVEGLRNAGCDARMLVRDKTSSAGHVFHARGEGRQFRARERGASLVQRKLVNPNRSELSNTWFSLSAPGCDVSQHPEVAAADLIHLHWVSGFLSPGSVRRLLVTARPLIWTLHDQRPFTGGCHFSAGCQGFASDCTPCPQLTTGLWDLTGFSLSEAVRQIDPAHLTVVCPSRWMADCALKSVLLRNARIEVIPNGVEVTTFKPVDAPLRKKLGVSDAAIVLLAGVDQSGEMRKGLHLLAEALRKRAPMWGDADVKVLVFGASEPPAGLDLPATWLGRIESPSELAALYSAADAFLLPSTEDNLPNTMIEALCCGTPVIGFRVGGIPDALEHAVNGILAESVSAESYAQALALFCGDAQLRRKFDRTTISTASHARFSMQAQSGACLRLYEDLLKGSAHRTGISPSSTGTAGALPAAPESPEFAAAFDNLERQANKQRWKNRWLKLSRRLGMGQPGASERGGR